MQKKAHKRDGGKLHFHRILSPSWRNDNNSNSRSGKKRPRPSRPRKSWTRGVWWKRIRTRALFLFCMIFLLRITSRFFQPSQLSFFSLHFFSLMRDSFFFFFFFFRVLDVPFVLVSKKQGREKDSGVLYASSSFRERRFCWRRR